MSVAVPRRPGRPSMFTSRTLVLWVVAAAVVIIIAVGLLSVSRRGAAPPSTAGLIPVLTPARPIPAYARINRDHLWDPRAGRISVIYLPPAAVTPEMLRNLSEVIGRVLDHEKTPGYVFTEADFLPPGTREGIVAGIPAGKRAVRITADEVGGLYGLRLGDRFDLLATQPIDARSGGSDAFDVAGVYGDQMALEARLSNWQKQATVRVIVQSGVIVEPMTVRGVPTVTSSLTEGGASRVRPVQEAVIAIDPSEVAFLTEAMAVDARIMTVPRSGRPDDNPDSITPALHPVSPFTGSASGEGDTDFAMVETIMGQRRARTAVPRH